MSSGLISVSPDTAIEECMRLMTRNRIRHLPVFEANQLAGIVSIGDIVKTQRDKYQGELDTLQAQVLGE